MTNELKEIKELMREFEGVPNEAPNRLCANFIHFDQSQLFSDSLFAPTSRSFGLVLDIRAKFRENNGVFRAYLKCDIDEDGESDQPTLDHVYNICSYKQIAPDQRQRWVIFHDLCRSERIAMRIDNIMGCGNNYIIISEEAFAFPHDEVLWTI